MSGHENFGGGCDVLRTRETQKGPGWTHANANLMGTSMGTDLGHTRGRATLGGVNRDRITDFVIKRGCIEALGMIA